MEGRDVLSVCVHNENYSGLISGDVILVRWEHDGKSSWYTCRVRVTTQSGCFVYNAGIEYYVDFDLDETLCRPAREAFDYIVCNPGCASIEVGSTKYLVPHEQLNFFDTMSCINALRVSRHQQPSPLQKSWNTETIGSFASGQDFKRVILAPLKVT